MAQTSPVSSALVGMEMDMASLTLHNDGSSVGQLHQNPSDEDEKNTRSSEQQSKGSPILRVGYSLITTGQASNNIVHLQVFLLATRAEQLFYGFGILCSVASGTILPLMTLVFGKFVTVFTQFSAGEINGHDFQSQVNHFTLFFVYFFVAKTALTYSSMVTFTIISTNVTSKLQTQYLRAVLRQPIPYHDTALEPGEVNQALSMHANVIRSGLSDKFGMTVQHISTVFAAFIVAITSVWKLSLAVMTVVPAAVVILGVTSAFDEKLTLKINNVKAEATTLADEIFGSMRIVRSLGAVDKLTKKYSSLLITIRSVGWKRAPIFGLQAGVYMFMLYAAYALAFWYGIRLYASGEVEVPGKVITSLFSVMIGLNSFSQVATYLGIFISAISLIQAIFRTIDLEHGSASSTEFNERTQSVVDQKEIQFESVSFEYPARPGIKVLKSFNLRIPPGSRTALVGTSGCGKSTCVGLLLRWYEPEEGRITVGGNSIDAESSTAWRSQIGVVQQEPQLFSNTVYENVILGLEGTSSQALPESEKRKLVIDACKIAHAHDFIIGLDHGYDTFLGEKGAQLSGGQKQRLALARAVVKNPSILILDEATSALDTNSEALVQKAIDRVSADRTILAVSHRLSTIKDYDNIVVISKGSILEQGTHSNLLRVSSGAYKKLWDAQALSKEQNSSQQPQGANISDQTASIEVTKDLSTVPTVRSSMEEDLRSKPAGLISAISQVLWRARRFWPLYIILVLAAAVGGALYPVQAILYAKTVNAFQKHGLQLKSAGNFWGLMWFILALVVALGYFCIGAVSTGLGESISQDFRSTYFRNLIRLPIAYFDVEENSPIKIVHRLATKPEDINSLAGSNLGVLVTVFVSFVGIVIVCFVTGWKFTLVVLAAALPAIFTASYLRERMEHSFESNAGNVFTACTAFASECVQAIRTVCSLNMECYVEKRFSALLKEHGKRAKLYAFRTMIWFALSESVEFLCMGFAFWYGGKLLSEKTYTTEQFFVIFIAIVFGSQSMGQYFAHSLDISKGVDAVYEIGEVERVVTRLECQPKIPLPPVEVESREPLIEFRNVSFEYPARLGHQVLSDFNIKIYAGQFVAFVGESGSGKSTLVGLLERFYKPTSGEILINGIPIEKIHGNDLIHLMSLVTQEPTLYRGTIQENMLLGTTQELSPEELEKLSSMTQLSDLITSLPEGYQTQVGAKGTSLSGGQRQRIAIARALARNCPVMLLDEATSALDTESEKLIQAAILSERQATRKTVIAIAHRLSTIRDAEVIYVLHGGRVVEAGSYEELVRQRGRFFSLVNSTNAD